MSVRVLEKVITEFDIQGIRNFKNCQNIKTLENFLHLVDEANICCGNPDIEIDQDGVTSQSIIKETNVQPRPQGHLCGRSEEIDDPGKGCKNLQDSWRFSSMRRQ